MFLLDTNVISELRKGKSTKADKNVIAWCAAQIPSTFFVSVISILEIEIGVLQMERRDSSQGEMLRFWLDRNVIPAFSGRTIPVDIEVARRCAQLQVPDPRSNRDAVIAATALVHGLTVVTRNVSDFEPMGVALYNPWVGSD